MFTVNICMGLIETEIIDLHYRWNFKWIDMIKFLLRRPEPIAGRCSIGYQKHVVNA